MYTARVMIIALITISFKRAIYNRGALRITYRQSKNVHGIGEAAYLDKPRETPAGSSNSRVRAWHASTMDTRNDRRGCRRGNGWRCTQVHLPVQRWTVNVAVRSRAAILHHLCIYVCMYVRPHCYVEHDISRLERARYPALNTPISGR